MPISNPNFKIFDINITIELMIDPFFRKVCFTYLATWKVNNMSLAANWDLSLGYVPFHLNRRLKQLLTNFQENFEFIVHSIWNYFQLQKEWYRDETNINYNNLDLCNSCWIHELRLMGQKLYFFGCKNNIRKNHVLLDNSTTR